MRLILHFGVGLYRYLPRHLSPCRRDRRLIHRRRHSCAHRAGSSSWECPLSEQLVHRKDQADRDQSLVAHDAELHTLHPWFPVDRDALEYRLLWPESKAARETGQPCSMCTNVGLSFQRPRSPLVQVVKTGGRCRSRHMVDRYVQWPTTCRPSNDCGRAARGSIIIRNRPYVNSGWTIAVKKWGRGFVVGVNYA